MNINSVDIEKYCTKNSNLPSLLLQKLNRETHLRMTKSMMLSGHILGQFYGEMTHMTQARNVLEIGTYTGYSTICIAENLPEKGKVHTIELDPENHWFANQFFAESDYTEKIISTLGDATQVIPKMEEKWDFVLIDAGKKQNDLYFEMVLPQVKKGGYIIVDNVIWKAKTMATKKDIITAHIDEFNRKMVSDPRVSTLMLPIRDGISLIRKK